MTDQNHSERENIEPILDTETAESTRAIPQPPKTSSRKRPCNKQGGRKAQARNQARRGSAKESVNERQPSARKLNQYVLDDLSGTISSVRAGEDIAIGRRVIEQPAGHPRPSINAFYDATLLPAGSTIIARWGDKAPELDPQLVARLGRLAKIAGYGEQARKTMFDQIARSSNPTTALQSIITELAGPDALTQPAGELTTTMEREALPELILRGINAGNDDMIEFAESLPMSLESSERLSRGLADIPGMIEDLEADGTGSILRVRAHRFEDKALICDALRDAGGRNIDVKNTHVEKDGRKMRAFIVSARFAASPVEIAAARTGIKPRVDYQITSDGHVTARYQVSLYGKMISTPDIPCEPTPFTVAALVRHLAQQDPTLQSTIDQIDTGVAGAAEAVALRLGPVRTLAQLQERIASVDLTADTVLGDGYTARLANAGDHIRSTDGRRVGVSYVQGAAVLDELSLHPTDQRILGLPEVINAVEDDTPAVVSQIRFETKKGSTRPRVIEESVEVAELNARRERFLAKREPREALLIECRENFLGEATRTMAAALVTPPSTREEVRNPEGLAKRVTFNRSIDPYMARSGDLVHLVQVLANSQEETQWSAWCRDQVKAYRDTVSRLRRENRDIPEDFFEVLGMNSSARSILLDAAGALLSERLGEKVSDDDVLQLASQAGETMREQSFVAVDRGRALAQFLKSKK